jgi:hypothetical protein
MPGQAKTTSKRKVEEEDLDGSATEVDEDADTEAEESVWVLRLFYHDLSACWSFPENRKHKGKKVDSRKQPSGPPPRKKRNASATSNAMVRFNTVGEDLVEVFRQHTKARKEESGYDLRIRAWGRLKEMETKLQFSEDTRIKLETLIFFDLKDFESFLAYPEERWAACIKTYLCIAAREEAKWHVMPR